MGKALCEKRWKEATYPSRWDKYGKMQHGTSRGPTGVRCWSLWGAGARWALCRFVHNGRGIDFDPRSRTEHISLAKTGVVFETYVSILCVSVCMCMGVCECVAWAHQSGNRLCCYNKDTQIQCIKQVVFCFPLGTSLAGAGGPG